MPDSEVDFEALRSLRSHYRSDTDSLGSEFFGTCLGAAVAYRRAAGYFSSSALVSWSSALPRAIAEGGLQIRLLISPHLTPEDVEALSREYASARCDEYLSTALDRIAAEIATLAQDGGDRGRFARLFAGLVVAGVVQVRLAYRRTDGRDDLFHEKFGIFDFPDASRVAFTGSANESASGHYRNFESVDVFRSWVPADAHRVETKSQQFDQSWANQTPGLRVIGLSERALSHLRAATTSTEAHRLSSNEDMESQSDARWAHQDEAVAAFLANQAGILEMATGTGKTRTALRVLSELVSAGHVQSVIISTEGNDLLSQWQTEVEEWLLLKNIRWPVYRHFSTYRESGSFRLSPRFSVLLASRDSLPNVLRHLSDDVLGQMLIIHDEVHGFGVPSVRSALGDRHVKIAWRLGLSATPERAYDAEGNSFIAREIGPTVYEFPLEKAIDRGVLSGFDYVPLDYELTEGDKGRIRNVFVRQAARAKQGRPMSKEEVWTELAKVYKTAEMKPSVFADYLRSNSRILRRCIVFVETMEYGAQLLDMIHSVTTRYRTYFTGDERTHLLAFARGDIDVLVTCHRVSQGIDIKTVEAVVLFASARSPLETIQRIGRCLRIDPSNPAKRATVVDFVRSSPEDAETQNADQERREWLSRIAQHPKEGT